MSDDLVAHDTLFPWKSAETLPNDRFVLAKIEHFRNQQPPKLIFARALEDGTALGSGGELNTDWHIAGWVDSDLEVDLRNVAAAQACILPLTWEEYEPGAFLAQDPFGGEYTFRDGDAHVRYTADASRILAARCDPFGVAQAHFETRMRNGLTSKTP